MTRNEIEQELIQGLASILSGNGMEVTSASTLADLGIDSLGLIEIFILIEKKFKLKLLESGIQRDDLRSVGTLAAYVASKVP